MGVPEITYLRDQTARHVKSLILAGEWGEWLPSERKLMVQLGVSRDTIRWALKKLEEEGLVQTKGKRRLILNLSSTRKTHVGSACDALVILSSSPLENVLHSHVIVIDNLREKLSRHGFEMHIRVSPRYGMTRSGKEFREIVDQFPQACFVLIQIPPQAQKWFQAQPNPVIVLGSSDQDIGLPFVDLDFEATCYHAASVLAARKKKRIAFIRRAIDLVGDQQSEHGLRRACKQYNCEPIVYRLQGDSASVIDWLAARDRSRTLPEGIIAADPAICLSVYSFCYQNSKRMPQELALICCGDDVLLEAVRPSVARYRINDAQYISRLWKLLLPMLRGDYYSPKAELIFPDYVPGESVGPPVLSV